VLEVSKGALSGEECKEANVNNTKLGNHSNDGGNNEPANVGKCRSNVCLRPNCLDNQRKDGEWSQHGDPIDHENKYRISFPEKENQGTIMPVIRGSLSEQDAAQSKIKEDGEEYNGCKVCRNKLLKDVTGDELGEDAIVEGVTQGDVITSTGGRRNEGLADISNLKPLVLFWGTSSTADSSIVTFRQKEASFIAAECDVGWRILLEVAFLEETLEAENGDQA
jgi:hypothetical protein